MSRRAMREELREARENRGAAVAVAVWTPSTRPRAYAPFTVVGDDVHVVVDPEAPDAAYLEAAVRLARLLALAKLARARGRRGCRGDRPGPSPGCGSSWRPIRALKTQLTSVTTVTKAVATGLDTHADRHPRPGRRGRGRAPGRRRPRLSRRPAADGLGGSGPSHGGAPGYRREAGPLGHTRRVRGERPLRAAGEDAVPLRRSATAHRRPTCDEPRPSPSPLLLALAAFGPRRGGPARGRRRRRARRGARDGRAPTRPALSRRRPLDRRAQGRRRRRRGDEPRRQARASRPTAPSQRGPRLRGPPDRGQVAALRARPRRRGRRSRRGHLRSPAQTVPRGRPAGRRPRAAPIARIDGVDERVDADVAIVDTGIDGSRTARGPQHRRRLQLRRPTNPDGLGRCRTATARTSPAPSARSTTASASSGVAPGVRLWAVRILELGGRRAAAGTSAASTGSPPSATRPTRRRPLFEAVNMSVAKTGTDDGNCGLTNNDVIHQAICRLVALGRHGRRRGRQQLVQRGEPHARRATTRSSRSPRSPTRTASPAGSAAASATRGAATTGTTPSPTSPTTAATWTSSRPASASGPRSRATATAASRAPRWRRRT